MSDRQIASGYHVGPGGPLDCPCMKAPCGLVVLEEALADCPYHRLARNTLTFTSEKDRPHPAYDCPGKIFGAT